MPKSARLVLTGGVCPLALQARKAMIAVMVLVGHGRWAGSDKVLTTWDDVQAQERRWTSPLTHLWPAHLCCHPSSLTLTFTLTLTLAFTLTTCRTSLVKSSCPRC